MKPEIDQQILNLLVARAMFDDIPDEGIVKRLHEWQCGSAACFGGWVAVHPYFQEQGIQRYGGAPVVDGSIWSADASAQLFGDAEMFNRNLTGRPDRAEIYRRIETQLNKLLDVS